YSYLGFSFFAVYFGRLMDLPPWVQRLTPLGHVPAYPMEAFRAAPLLALTALALALIVPAFLLYRRRDVQTQ
ncbi:MAG: ABC transporter permease, partial [Clostridiales bacterium]|nr:ABC transporter permease [Clostridiales bacterium]